MSHLIQHLNTVVLCDEAALPVGVTVPPSPLFADPSSPGPASSWGTGAVTTDPNTGGPFTGADARTRVPRIGGGAPDRRKGGSGNQPNKNVGQAGGGGTAYCTNVLVDYRYHVGAPNIGGFDGTSTTFDAIVCYPWTTIDTTNFAAEVAAQKAVIAAKADDFISIVNQKANAKAFVLGLGNPTCTLEFLGATVTTPTGLNTCTFKTPNSCSDPNY